MMLERSKDKNNVGGLDFALLGGDIGNESDNAIVTVESPREELVYGTVYS